MHYLYTITNQQNGKVYVGQSIDEKGRWKQHKYFAKNPEKSGQYIHRAMAKHGIEHFSFEVIALCVSQADADYTEDQLINQYDSRNKEKGYNLKSGGSTGLMSEESKAKIREWWQAHPEVKQELSERMIGNTFAENVIHTEEWKQNHSEFMKSHPNNGTLTSERLLGNQINLGRKHSDEVNKKKGIKGGNSSSFKPGQTAWNKGLKRGIYNG